MNTLCIIPARGGSKRIPRKNIRSLHGRPLLAWTIATAQAAEVFSEIMVSTDDDEIASIARDSGAAVPFPRSAENSHDHASTTLVVEEVLARYSAAGREPFELVCCLYPTAVLLRPEHLRIGFGLLRDHPEWDSSLSVQAYRHPIERAYHVNSGLVTPIDPSKVLVRTQDLEPAFHDAGQFYWFRPELLSSNGRLLGRACAPVKLNTWEAVDLDNEADWQFLERLMAAARQPA